MKIRMSILYAASLASLTLFFGLWEGIAYFGIRYSQIILFSIVLAGVPLIYTRKPSDLAFVSIFSLFTLGIMLISSQCIHIKGDIMHTFILLLVTSLLLASLKDSLNLLYSGLSFYIVGIFLLLAYAGIEIIIVVAQIADYYIGCVGAACAPPQVSMNPSVVLFIMAIPAAYPYFKKFQFRRDIYDKEGS